MNKVLAVPDIHAPFHDKAALGKALQLIKKIKPDFVIQLGDAFDCYSYSRFPHDPNIYTPRDEIREARLTMEEFWRCVRKYSKKSECIQVIGNHSMRIGKKLTECLPQILGMYDWKEVLRYDGVTTIEDPRSVFEIDGVIYCHGWFTGVGQHMKYFNQSVVHGHTHRASLTFMAQANGEIFELDCGHIGDETSAPMSYTNSKRTHWVKAVGLIDGYGPRLIPLSEVPI